jgi:cytochrome c biogenesis protein CcmG, thiol:disulfide interchange protein DsbE
LNRFALPLVAFLLLVIVLAAGIRHAHNLGIIASPLVGRAAPGFSLPSLTDAKHIVRSQDLKGRWYLLNVWGTWCFECRAEHSMLLEAGHSGAIPIIGLDWKDEDDRALEWLSQLGNPYQAIAVDHDGRTAIDWGVYGAPESFLVNADGVVVYKLIGPLTRESWTQEILPRLPHAAKPGSS